MGMMLEPTIPCWSPRYPSDDLDWDNELIRQVATIT
jgi:hypothetical protein